MPVNNIGAIYNILRGAGSKAKSVKHIYNLVLHRVYHWSAMVGGRMIHAIGKDEGNCGHWEYDVQYPIVPRRSAESSREQILMPVNFEDVILMSHRNDRFTRATSHRATFRLWRLEVSFDLGRHESGQRALPIDLSSDLIPDPHVVEHPTIMVQHHPIMVCNAQRRSLASEATEPRSLELLGSPVADSEIQRSDFVVYEDASADTEMVGSSRMGSSDLVQEVHTSSGRARSESQHILNGDGYANENWNPLSHWNGSGINERRSPLPEWFPRSPLQDITNVLASGTDPEAIQQKKKCKKVTLTLPPPPVLIETPIKATNKWKIANSSRVVPSCAVAKQASSTLRKGFR